MNKEAYLAFLSAHQPMKDHPGEEALRKLNEAVGYFYNHPDEACIPLLLNVFGDWDDLETYDGIILALRQFPASSVRPHLEQALRSPHKQVRQWSLDASRYFVDESLLPYLEKAFSEPEPIIRMTAAAALEVLATPAAQSLAKRLLLTETEDDVREILECV